MHSKVCSCLFIVLLSQQKLFIPFHSIPKKFNAVSWLHKQYQLGAFPNIPPYLLSDIYLLNECRAYEDYKTVFAAGEDGRPHWVARKTCNYLTEAIDVIASSYIFKPHMIHRRAALPQMPDTDCAQVCGNGLLEGGCMDEEKLAKHKDEQVLK